MKRELRLEIEVVDRDRGVVPEHKDAARLPRFRSKG